jgi:cell division septal protein FtsQ
MSEISSIGLKGESDFLRRKNNRIVNKQKKIKSIKLKGFHLVLILIIFTIAGFAAYKAGEFIMTWEKFKVSSFKLLNSPGLEAKVLKKMLAKYSTNIFSLNITELKKELLKLREVKDAALSRKLPSTIEVTFYLRKPVFQVIIKDKNRYKYELIDEEGVALYTSDTRKEGLVTIKGIKQNEWKKILPYLGELNKVKKTIDYVSLKEPYGVTLKLKGIREIFYPGEKNFAYKINYYLKLRRMPLLKKYRVRYVDLRFEDRFYLEYENDEEVNS